MKSGRRVPRVKLDTLPKGKAKKVLDITKCLLLDDGQVDRLMSTMRREMRQGLSRHEEDRARTCLQMENTFVRAILDGSENGDFLALDLGGTNFRVLLCRMRDGVCTSTSRNYKVPKSKLTGPAAGVFDHLAESIHKFLTEEDMLDKCLPLGFTFSFPMVQQSLRSGLLITWTKSFKCTDGVGQDAVVMLEEALERHGDYKVHTVAVLNDTTGTLLAGSYLDHQCRVGVILGTGSNVAYMERRENVDKWLEPGAPDDHVIVDLEWGAFGDNGSLDFFKTHFDDVIDQHSNHVGSFTFEKLFAGHYVGDLARLVLVKLAQEGVIFDGEIGALAEWGTLTAAHLSHIERDTNGDMSNTIRAMDDVGLTAWDEDDLTIVRYVASVLSLRCAQIVAPALAVLLNHMDEPEVAIAVDGSLFRCHPELHKDIQAWLNEKAPSVKSRLVDAEDGSGRGAAFAAAVAVRPDEIQPDK